MAPEHIEVAEGISHVSNVARAVLRHRRILVDADGAPVEVQVMLVPVELRDPEEERSRPVQRRQVRAAIEPEPDALAILVAWAVPDHVDRPRLQRGEAIGGGRGRGAADVGRRAEVAGAWVIDDAVGHAVSRIARGDGGRGRLVELRRRNRPAEQILHHDLPPHLGGLKARPVDRGRVGEDTVELLPQLLREQIPLPPAGRAPVPVVVRGRDAVVGARDHFRQHHLLLDRVADEVVDELQVVRAVLVHTGFAVAAGVAGVRSGPDITGIHRRRDVHVAGTSTAADALRAAVPGALNAARAAVQRIERQAGTDIDVLLGRRTVQHVHPAMGLVHTARRDECAGCSLDDRIACQPDRRIGRELDAVHGDAQRLRLVLRRRDRRAQGERGQQYCCETDKGRSSTRHHRRPSVGALGASLHTTHHTIPSSAATAACRAWPTIQSGHGSRRSTTRARTR